MNTHPLSNNRKTTRGLAARRTGFAQTQSGYPCSGEAVAVKLWAVAPAR